MHKALIPMVASLALCGAAATALVISSARAEPGPRKPVMVATAAQDSLQLAANDQADGAPPPPRMPGRNLNNTGAPPDRTARLDRMCRDLYARRTGELAYTEARLDLTAAERPLFQRWKDAKLSIAQRQADSCTKLPDRAAAKNDDATRPGPGEMMAREETMLKQRLADIEAERPALDALYNALTPAQRMELAGPRGRMEGGMMRRAMFRQPMGPRDPGFMGDGPMPPPGPDAGPMPPR